METACCMAVLHTDIWIENVCVCVYIHVYIGKKGSEPKLQTANKRTKHCKEIVLVVKEIKRQ